MEQVFWKTIRVSVMCNVHSVFMLEPLLLLEMLLLPPVYVRVCVCVVRTISEFQCHIEWKEPAVRCDF